MGRGSILSRALRSLSSIGLLLLCGCPSAEDIPAKTYNPELEYLRAINEAGPLRNPRLIFLLTAEYLNSNQLEAGIEFFTRFVDEHGAQMSSDEKSVYLGVLGLLRATYAPRVPPLKRTAWVEETIATLEEARTLTKNESFLIRWITGVVYAQLPEQFDKRTVAREDLQWILQHHEEAPEVGLLREIYYQLAVLFSQEENEADAQTYLALSGYGSFRRDISTLTAYAVTAEQGHTFYPRQFREVVPGRVFALSGFEFTEYYFIVSNDGNHLISIDAGTRPDSAKAAYEFLTSRYRDLPPLTTVLVTHSHWDHVGGHRYFRELTPTPRFYARDNYREELERSINTVLHFRWFFGKAFENDLLVDFKPDVTVSKRTTMTVGGTRFELIPIAGGETPDGIFIHMPEERILFAGDFIMPYLGAPFVEEGNLGGLLEALDIVQALNPDHLLHGHETLTREFNPPTMLVRLKAYLAWLERETLMAIRKGIPRPAIHHLNLVPPDVLTDTEAQLPYLILRENVINRIYDQNIGYWGWEGSGMDHLSDQDYGVLLSHYLGASEREIVDAVQRMLQSGDYSLAVKAAGWAGTQYDSEQLNTLRKRALLQLKAKYQFHNPFKHIVYSEMAEHETPQLELPGAG